MRKNGGVGVGVVPGVTALSETTDSSALTAKPECPSVPGGVRFIDVSAAPSSFTKALKLALASLPVTGSLGLPSIWMRKSLGADSASPPTSSAAVADNLRSVRMDEAPSGKRPTTGGDASPEGRA